MKKIMFYGGAGRVGNLIVPLLTDYCEAHVFDLHPPEAEGAIYHEGDVTDRDAVRAAAEGMDAVVYMVMVPEPVLNDPGLSYDLNLKGLHFVLDAVHDLGIEQAIYCSTGSVYDGLIRQLQGCVSDDMPPAARKVYGMSKALGEQVCEWFCRWHGLTVTVLRLYRPVSLERWNEVNRGRDGRGWSKMATLDRDLARAVRLTLDAGLQGYHLMSISGDWNKSVVDCERARELIGWEPTVWSEQATG